MRLPWNSVCIDGLGVILLSRSIFFIRTQEKRVTEGGKEELKAECNVIELQKKSNILTHFILGFSAGVAKHSLACCGIQAVPPYCRCDQALGSTHIHQVPAVPGELETIQALGTFLHCSWREGRLEEALCACVCTCVCTCMHTHACTHMHTCYTCTHEHACMMHT